MPETKKMCFMIMPITTPDSILDKYRDGDRHFQHVMECLFMPAIQKAGFEPIPPAAKGSDLIHAEIVHNLESSELVLCDMSSLNPNVFFEFGIRTSLNKPVSVVKDEMTPKIPFDTGILNYHEYRSSLDPWDLGTEVEKLAEHLRISEERSKGENTLWRYFGLKSEAKPYEGEPGIGSQLDLMAFQLDSIRQRLDGMDRLPEPASDRGLRYPVIQHIIAEAIEPNAHLTGMADKDYFVLAEYVGDVDSETIARLTKEVRERFGIEVIWLSRTERWHPSHVS